jgi:hypothetical protein
VRDSITKHPADVFPCRLFTAGERYLLEWILPETVDAAAEFRFVHELRKRKKIAQIGGRSFTPLSSPGEIISGSRALAPSLFIYHATRCGSTLMGRMLGANVENRVFNEPRAVTELLMSIRSIDDPSIRMNHLKNVIGAFGLGAPSRQKNPVFKFASLCNFSFDDIHGAFPITPSVFIYRDPVEIMAGLVSEPPKWLYDIHYEELADILPWSKEKASMPGLEHRCCLYLERQFQWALARADGFTRLVNYTDLPEAAFEIAGIFLNSEIHDECARVLPWNVKKPHKPFVPDSQKKQNMASPLVRELAQTRLYPLYRKLEAKRVERLSAVKALVQRS